MFKSNSYFNNRNNRLKRIKKDYQPKNLNNPFFHKKLEKKSDKRKKIKYYFGSLFFLFILFIFLFYFFILSDFFTLKQIKINGVNRIDNNQIENLVWQQAQLKNKFFLKQNNLLFFKTDLLSENLLNNFSFAKVVIDKKWPHTLIINVNERDVSFIWQDFQGRSFSDSRGCLIKEAPVKDEDLKIYPVLTAINNQNYLDKNSCLLLHDFYFKFFFSVYEKLKNYPEFNVKEFVFNGSFYTLRVQLNNGPYLLFNVRNDLDQQFNKLLYIKQKQEQDNNFKNLKYIDLRYGDKSSYCF